MRTAKLTDIKGFWYLILITFIVCSRIELHRVSEDKMLNRKLQINAFKKKKYKNVQRIQNDHIESKSSCSRSFKENIDQYLWNSTLHGLKYIGDRTITRFER